MCCDYGFRAGSGRLYQEKYGEVPGNVFEMVSRIRHCGDDMFDACNHTVHVLYWWCSADECVVVGGQQWEASRTSLQAAEYQAFLGLCYCSVCKLISCHSCCKHTAEPAGTGTTLMSSSDMTVCHYVAQASANFKHELQALRRSFRCNEYGTIYEAAQPRNGLSRVCALTASVVNI